MLLPRTLDITFSMQLIYEKYLLLPLTLVKLTQNGEDFWGRTCT